MGIFDLDDWRTLWNLNKPPKSYRSQHSYSSVNTGLNRSYGDLSSNHRRYMARREPGDEVDSRSFHSMERQSSRSSGKRGGSLPPPMNRRTANQSPSRVHNPPNGMVEPISRGGGIRTVLPPKKQPAALPVNSGNSSSESGESAGPIRQSPAQSSPQRPVSKINLTNDSSWIKSGKDLDSSQELLDTSSPPTVLAAAVKPQSSYAAKEPVKSWENKLSRKSTENLSSRYANPARSSARNLPTASDDQPTTFNEARRKFQQLAQASSARHTQDPYNEPLRVKFNSQQNITQTTKTNLKQYQSAVGLDVYDYPVRKDTDNQTRENLYNGANSSGLPEPVRSTAAPQEAKPARALPTADANASARPGRNIALLGLSSDNSEAEVSDALVTSTPRSSTRKSKLRENNSDPNWDTLDIVLKRSKTKSADLGFVIRGGLGQEVRPGDPQIYVSQIIPGEAAALDGKLRVGDVIIAVNGSDMKSMSHKTATRLLSIAGSSVRLTVKRFVGKVHIMLITLVKNGQPLGLTVTGGVGNEVRGGGTAIYVKDINPKGVAYRTGGIEVGDQIQKVNSTPLVDASHHFATETLRNAGDPVHLLIAKTGRVNPLLFSEQ